MKIIKLLFVLMVTQVTFGQLAQINWVTFEKAQELNKTEPKLFFFDIYTDWCGYCKKMDKETFAHPQIAAYMNQHYYCIKFNAETVKDTISLHGVDYNLSGMAGQRGAYHNFATFLNGGKRVSGYPSYSFLDSKLNVLSPIGGFIQGAQFEMIIKYFGDNNNRTSTWPDYQKAFKNEFSF